MMLVPFKDHPQNPEFKFPHGKFSKISLALAAINAVDSKGRIRGNDNKFIEKTNAMHLIKYLYEPTKNKPLGLTQFCNLLKEAKFADKTIKAKEMIENIAEFKSIEPTVNVLEKEIIQITEPKIPKKIPLVVNVEIPIDNKRSTRKTKPKSKPVNYIWETSDDEPEPVE